MLQVISFGLKDTRATYQKFVNIMLAYKLDMTKEVYNYEMVVKNEMGKSNLDNFKDLFIIAVEYGIRLNPTKFVFDVYNVKFLGYLITHMGIISNTGQFKAITEMPSPRTKRGIQKLTRRMAPLTHFISRY